MARKMTLEDIPDDILKVFKKKLQSGKVSLGLGSYAYTPLNKQLSKWKSSDGGELSTSLQGLIDGWAEPWFKNELYSRIQDENWDRIFSKANIFQDEYEAHFLKNMSVVSLAKNVKKISEELLEKKIAATYILETRKKLNKAKQLISTISDLLEDMSKEDVDSLNKQLDHAIKYLEEIKSKVI